MDDAPAFEAALDYLRDMDEIPGVRAMKARTYELVGARPGARILDVGCGDGADVDRIAEIVGPAGEAVGLDPSHRLLEQARARHRGRFVAGSAEAPPFAPGSFDGARLDRVVVHLPAPRTALSRLVEVVRPGGCVLVCETHFAVEGDDPQPDPAAVDLLMRRITGEEREASWIGHYVPLLMRQAGLAEQSVELLEQSSSDPDDLLRCLGLWRRRPPLPAHAEAWLARVLAEMSDGRRRLRLHCSVVTGRVQ
jgi:ubiquinone/menaquinone biosynthesis C-methylase UbiE